MAIWHDLEAHDYLKLTNWEEKIMKYKREEMLDLNEENVKKIFAYCVATPQTLTDNIRRSSFFSPSCNVKMTKMNFDKIRLKKVRNSINYMLGQLKPVHSHSLLMSLQEGYRKYDNTLWTENKITLFSLYFLGTATIQLPHFEHSINNPQNFDSPINRQIELKPTLSPNDPNFKKWCSDNMIVE